MTVTQCTEAFAGLAALDPCSAKFAQPPAAPRERGLVIPYLTARSGERVVPQTSVIVRPDGQGIGYRHERPGERDQHNVLWMRCSPPDRDAKPRFKVVHPLRQREVMLGLLCQVCGGQPSSTRKGMLFFQKQDPDADPMWWPNSEFSLHPPICLTCAHAALSRCRFVAHAQAVRVRKPRIWGVWGTGYRPGPSGTLRSASEDVRCAYTNRQLSRWVIAQQAIVELNRCTLVDIRDELAAAGLDVPGAGAPSGKRDGIVVA